ncbi:MAG: hypothetical protein HY554_15025 [Elusimicrobia bacterium]|nr:hypothetical protein [Elusimicrobiota bacterium]
MTLRDLIAAADDRWPLVIGSLAAVPLAAAALGRLHPAGRGGDPPWKHLYAALVYAACIPGMFAASLVGYALLFTGENLIDASFAVYFAPLVSMPAALATMRRNVDFDQVPGFDRIWGLLGVLLVSFTAALALHRSRLLLVFGGSLWTFAALAAALFGVLRASARAVIGPGHPGRP